MTRKNVEHVLRASGALTGCREMIVLGSQAILGPYPNAPPELLISEELDLYPPAAPEKADLIDGSIGEMSPFHKTFGYYAHGVGPETAILPAQWKSRLVRLENENTGGIVGWFVSPADLAVGILIAGGEKDFNYVGEMLRAGLLTKPDIRNVANELSPAQSQLVTMRLKRF